MLQNALNDWYGVEHGLETWWNLKVSVHGGFESVFWNYQQLIKAAKTGISLVRFRGKPTLWNQDRPLYGYPLTSQRSPVSQQELFNGWIYLLLKGEKCLLNEIKEALMHPRKVLSLGRSEDVVFIRKVKFVEGKEKRAKEVAFKIPTYVATPIEHLQKKEQKKEYPTYSIPIKVVFRNEERPVKHKAEINTNTFRDVEFKTVIYVGAWTFLKFKEKVTLEEYSIEGKTLKVVTDGSVSGWL